MSVFGPNQVEELIIGDAVAAETTVATFIASASDNEIAVLSADGSEVAAGEKFKLLQKTAGSAAKGLNFEFSDLINPSKVDKIILKEHSAEVNKSATATVGSASANTTYVLECRLYNDGGTLSPENFAIVSGYYVTGGSAGTIQAIRDGLITSLQANLTLRGGGELSVTPSSTDAIVIAGIAQDVVAGKITGRQIEFEVAGKSFAESQLVPENTEAITVVVANENFP